MKKWDVFISHASEDKESVARPLADLLRQAGLKVWLDRQELKLGDSLREKIDRGLAESRFGIVILSKRFLEKRWPNRELSALVALEEGGEKAVLPVWHEITQPELALHSPLLADRLAVSTDKGMQAVAEAILEVVLETGSDSPSAISPNATRVLLNLLESGCETPAIIEFFRWHTQILRSAFVPLGRVVIHPVGETVRFIGIDRRRTLKIERVVLIHFCGVSGPLLDKSGILAGDVLDAMATLAGSLEWVEHNVEEFCRSFTPPLFEMLDASAILIGRRRGALASEEIDCLRERQAGQMSYPQATEGCQFPGVVIRTYDSLLDPSI